MNSELNDLNLNDFRLIDIFKQSPISIELYDKDGILLEVNQACVDLFGLKNNLDIKGFNLFSNPHLTPEMTRDIKAGRSIKYELKYDFDLITEKGFYQTSHKGSSFLECFINPTINAKKEITGYIVHITEITERKKAEEALKESEERFKLLYEKAPVGYQSLDECGNLIDVNEIWLEMTGYAKEEVVGKSFFSFLSSEHKEYAQQQFEVFKKNRIIHTELELIRKDGSTIIIQLEGKISHTNEGLFKQTHCILFNITERLKAEKAVADERILLRTLIDNIPDPIYVKDTKGRKLISNKADLEILGYTNEKSIFGKTDLELNYKGDAVQTFKDDLAVIRTGQPILNKLESFTDLKDTKRYFLTSKIPLTNDSDEIIGLVGVGHDITIQKQSEQKIIQLFKGFAQSPASIVITDTSGNIEYVNSKFTEITGYTFDEVKGKNPRILQSGNTPQSEYDKLWKTITSGNEYHSEFQNKRKNGELYWESIQISPIRDEDGAIVNYMAIKEDITNRKKTEHEILKLSVAVEQNPTSIIITDTKGVIEYTNQKFLDEIGYQREELNGKALRIFNPGHTTEEIYNELWHNLLEGKTWKGEQQNRTKNREPYWESVLISPIKNHDGEITNFIIISENISERKKMEKDLIKAKEKAEESDRLKSAFLANMSHEIRTPLNSILGFSDLLTTPDLDSQTREEFASLINSSGNNLLAIINDILDISKIEAGQIVLSNNAFSAQKLLAKIQKEYSYRADAKGIEIRMKPRKTITEYVIMSDEARIRQILVNFVGNALKFTDSGYIELDVELTDDEILFSVKDTGIGIKKEYHDKIFERFRQIETAQTRKYSGNGLGLAITKNLAELLGGRVGLESEPNKGSTFYFALPKNIIEK